MDKEWVEIKIITKSEAIEPVSGIFYGLDVKGVAIEDPNDILTREQGPLTWDFADLNILEYGGKAAVVKGYFDKESLKDDIDQYIKNKLNEIKEMGIDIGEGKVIIDSVNEEDWANNWKKYYKPTRIGKRIVVKPIWEEYKKEGNDIVIELDPGMAFGTGTHETTRMCVQALEKYIKHQDMIFDVGTGSGILAIAAAKLGSKEVMAVDLDPVAVDSARQNVSFNDISNIKVMQGNLLDVVNGKADIVVANIIAEIIILLTDDVKKSLNQGGLFISSGIIRERQEAVMQKLIQSGFEIMEINTDGEWVCIVSKLKGES
jgi:ribosomal protein L11 methyltransferase